MYGNIVLLDNGLCLWHNAGESAESGGTIIMLSILKDPMEGLNYISPRYWSTSSAHA